MTTDFITHKAKRDCALLTLSFSPSFSSAPCPLSALQPFVPSPVPSHRSGLSPTVSTSARSPSVSTWSLWRLTVVSVEYCTFLDTTVHPSHVPSDVELIIAL